MITVDSRGCGEGKTTTNIIPSIKQHVLDAERVLLVVPGIKLQEQYRKYLPGLTDREFVVVNSKQSDRTDGYRTVVQTTIDAMTNPNAKLVCITHACFKRLQLSTPIKSSWHLIIDEAFDPYSSITYKRNQSTFNWLESMTPTGVLEGEYAEVEMDEARLDNWSLESEAVRSMLDKNWQTYISINNCDELGVDTGKGRVEVFQQMNPRVLEDWLSVHIAAAAIDTTFMGSWMRRNKLTYTVTHPFVVRDLPVILHTIDRLDWSMRKEVSADYQTYAREYIEYVKQHTEDNHLQLLALRNNRSERAVLNEERLTHNPHGINSLTHYTAISVESAINPSKEFARFLQEFGQMEPKEVTRAFSSYLFYQCVMRTALRVEGNTKTVHVYGLDEKSMIALMDYFTPADHQTIASSYEYQEPLTAAERNRQARLRKRAEQLANTPVTKMYMHILQNRNAIEDNITESTPAQTPYVPKDPTQKSYKEAKIQEIIASVALKQHSFDK